MHAEFPAAPAMGLDMRSGSGLQHGLGGQKDGGAEEVLPRTAWTPSLSAVSLALRPAGRSLRTVGSQRPFPSNDVSHALVGPRNV